MSRPFAERYGPWAVVAGASEGLGAAFAAELARRGLSVALVARRADRLATAAAALRAEHGVDVLEVVLDLGRPDAVPELAAAVGDREVGLVVANAAYAPAGRFLDVDPADLSHALDVNTRTPLLLARRFAPAMVARGRGGIVLMASLAGLQGGPGLSTYAATKAFELVLAEGLWHELGRHGVDVVASCAGAIETPNMARAMAKRAPGTLAPERVVRDTLAALGRGPRVVPGGTNQAATFVMNRLLPRRAAVRIMARATERLVR